MPSNRPEPRSPEQYEEVIRGLDAALCDTNKRWSEEGKHFDQAQRQLLDAAMLLRMSIMKLKRGNGSDRCFADKIWDWLKRNNLQGSILR